MLKIAKSNSENHLHCLVMLVCYFQISQKKNFYWNLFKCVVSVRNYDECQKVHIYNGQEKLPPHPLTIPNAHNHPKKTVELKELMIDLNKYCSQLDHLKAAN